MKRKLIVVGILILFLATITGLILFYSHWSNISSEEAKILEKILIAKDNVELQEVSSEFFAQHFFQRNEGKGRDSAVAFFTNTYARGFIDVQEGISNFLGQNASFKVYYNTTSDYPERFLFGFDWNGNESADYRWQLQPFGYIYNSRTQEIEVVPTAPWEIGYQCGFLNVLSGCHKGVKLLFFDKNKIVVHLDDSSNAYPDSSKGIYILENNVWSRLTENVGGAHIFSDGCTLLYAIGDFTLQDGIYGDYYQVDICKLE